MEVLVFGGTVFVSRAMVAAAVAAGHRVTAVNRGKSGLPVEGAETVLGDRTDPDLLAALAKGRYDLVIDAGYVPSVVRPAAEALTDVADHYCFVSTVNTFPGWPTEPDYRTTGTHEGDPDSDDVPAGLDQAGPYGWHKVGCERAVERAFGADRSTVMRAGVIVGPGDPLGRLPWWLDRIGRGGRVLAPGPGDGFVSLVDARDLADFALLRAPGTTETTGPVGELTRAQLFALAAEVTGGDPVFSWVDGEWLARHGVQPWTEIPLWTPVSGAPSMFGHHPEAAVAAGLRYRPVRDTLADTWAWMAGGWAPAAMTPGLAADKEAELLREWDAAAP